MVFTVIRLLDEVIVDGTLAGRVVVVVVMVAGTKVAGIDDVGVRVSKPLVSPVVVAGITVPEAAWHEVKVVTGVVEAVVAELVVEAAIEVVMGLITSGMGLAPSLATSPLNSIISYLPFKISFLCFPLAFLSRYCASILLRYSLLAVHMPALAI